MKKCKVEMQDNLYTNEWNIQAFTDDLEPDDWYWLNLNLPYRWRANLKWIRKHDSRRTL